MCGVYGAGSSCRCGARREACPVGRRITLPPRRPRGAWRFWLPADSAFSLLFCPLSPQPPSPAGKGEIFVILLQGASPLESPRAGGARHWFGGRWRRPAGAYPVGRRFYLPFRHPAGGLPSLSPVYPAFSLLSCPHPPTRARRALFPAGRGRFLLFYCKGLRPLHPPGLAGRGTGSVLRKQFGLVSPEDAGYSYSQ